MNTKRNRRIALIAAGAAVVLGLGIGATVMLSRTGDEAPAAVETTAPAPVATPTDEPVTAPTPTGEPTPAVPTGYGEVVPAEMVEAARKAGAQVYASPYGDGSGVVVEPGTFPEAARVDAEAITSEITGMAAVSDQLKGLGDVRTAMDAAGLKAVFIVATGEVTTTSFTQSGYKVTSNKTAADAGFAQAFTASKSEALAAAQAFADAHPGTAVFDKTA